MQQKVFVEENNREKEEIQYEFMCAYSKEI